MSKSPRSPVRSPIKARTLSELGDADEASYPFLQESFPATLGALGLEHRRPSFSAWSDAVGQHDVLGSFTDDEPSDDDDEPAPRARLVAPSKFGRPAEDSGWQPEERAVRDAALARLDAGAAAHLRANDLLFLRLVRGFRLLEDRAAATADMCAWVADRRLAWDAARLLPAVGDDLRFHEAVWPTWVAGRDGFGHLVVLERLGCIDFDALLKLPLDLILKRRVQALDGLQRELARPLEGYGRVYKCVFLVDVAGASFGTLMRGETMTLAKAYAKLTERMYADAVWKNVVVNAPAVARGAWRVVEKLLDDETKDLISFVHAPPGAADTPGKLRAAGVRRPALHLRRGRQGRRLARRRHDRGLHPEPGAVRLVKIPASTAAARVVSETPRFAGAGPSPWRSRCRASGTSTATPRPSFRRSRSSPATTRCSAAAAAGPSLPIPTSRSASRRAS